MLNSTDKFNDAYTVVKPNEIYVPIEKNEAIIVKDYLKQQCRKPPSQWFKLEDGSIASRNDSFCNKGQIISQKEEMSNFGLP